METIEPRGIRILACSITLFSGLLIQVQAFAIPPKPEPNYRPPLATWHHAWYTKEAEEARKANIGGNYTVTSPNVPPPPPSVYWDEKSGLTIGVGALYVEFGDNDTDFASTSNRDFNIDNDFHFGFNIDIGYRFPYISNGINLNYTRIYTNDSSSVIVPDLFVDGINVDSADGKIEHSLDSVNFFFYHHINLPPISELNIYGGLNYTHLGKDMTVTGSNPIFGFHSVKSGTDFDGAGPAFGFDFTFHPLINPRGVGVFFDLETAFPYGTMSGYLKSFDNNQLIFIDHIPDETFVVPRLGGKIGLRYDPESINMRFELGYETETYFDATKTSSYAGSKVNTSYEDIYLKVAGNFLP